MQENATWENIFSISVPVVAELEAAVIEIKYIYQKLNLGDA